MQQQENTLETMSGYLARDHHHCDTLLRRVGDCVFHQQWPEARLASLAFQAALERHLLLEERVLFPAFERALGRDPCPTGAMRGEHLRIRAMAQRVADSVAACDRAAFATHADVLLLVLHEHGEKEEGVIYPMIERVLAHRCKDVLAALRAFGVPDTCESAA